MRAIRIHEFGGPEVLKLEEVPIPRPAPGEVLVSVHATSVNPVDWRIRSGQRKEKFPVQFPFTPGWDVSGVVQEVGEGVQGLKAGDEVYGRPHPTRNGAYAEYIALPADELAKKPKSIDHIHAAAVPLAGLTAWQGLFDHGHLTEGQRVLIHGASGGVGTLAVQFAKWKGAHVIGTASEKNFGLLNELGADELIDYRQAYFWEKLSNLDLVFDTIGGETQRRSLDVIRPGGRLITTLKPEYVDEAKTRNIHLEGYTAQAYPHQLEAIASLIDERSVKPVIYKVMELEDAAAAQQESQGGHVNGKIILKVAGK
ncbi:NADP-dependent oxidoreductase [Parapedobacter sp. ISTM3]|uniref:NADPH:quinone reductase n=1 Tax=Parapedobacter luteus TaxID=623280 RepID=A0A1T5APM6_9SPHI|nr:MULTISPECIES: NADP-dependent oxidoreductase [Parapedobacter]MBK1441913.1 NADP-dependent oxidoreductase [Parapedobacter sp. ISTM3]SKB36533.1 NADPH:quinone reductase [Parapedobacter luteus]